MKMCNAPRLKCITQQVWQLQKLNEPETVCYIAICSVCCTTLLLHFTWRSYKTKANKNKFSFNFPQVKQTFFAKIQVSIAKIWYNLHLKKLFIWRKIGSITCILHILGFIEFPFHSIDSYSGKKAGRGGLSKYRHFCDYVIVVHSALNYKQKCEIFRKSHRLLPKDKTNAFGDFFELSGPGGSSEDFFFFKIPT